MTDTDLAAHRLALLLHFLGRGCDLGFATRQADAGMSFVESGAPIPKPPPEEWERPRADLLDAFHALAPHRRVELAALAKAWVAEGEAVEPDDAN